MILIFLSITALAMLSVASFNYSGNGYDGRHMFACLFGIIGIIVSAFAYIVFAIGCYNWAASDYKAKIINREYKTSYTREEIFYGSDVIDTIRQLDRQRLEVNGDLMKDKSK